MVDNCAGKKPVRYNRVMTEISDQYTVKAEKLAGEAQYTSSNFYLKKAIPIYKKAGNWLKMVQCYIKLGDNFKDLDEYKKALGNLDLALKLTLNYLGHKPLALAKSYIKLAYKYFHQKKDFEKALELYRKALDIKKEILGENHREIAKIYNSISLVYWNKGDAGRASIYYNKSFSIKLKNLMEQGIDIVRNYKFLDNERVKKGTFSDREDAFRESLFQDLETYGRDHPITATIHENIGILQALEGSYSEAMENLRKSLTIRLNNYGQDNLKTASSYHNMGICLRLQGEHDQALRFLDNALSIKLNLLGRYHSETAETYYQLGNVYYSRFQFDEALTYFQNAIVSMVPTFSSTDVQANPTYIKAYSNDRLLKTLAAKARALWMRYLYEPARVEDLRVSLDTHLLAADLIDNIRGSFKSENYKLFFGAKCIEIYGLALQTAQKLYEISGNSEYKELAFIFSEKSKAAVLTESLSESRARKFAGIPGYLLEREKRLRTDLALYDTYLEKEYGKNPALSPSAESTPKEREGEKVNFPGKTLPKNNKKDLPVSSRIKSIEEHYFSLKEEYRDLIEHFESNYPKYFDLKYNSRTVSIPTLQRALAPGTAIIEYFLAEKSVHIFLLTDRFLETAAQPVGADFTAAMEDFYNSIKKIEEKSFLRLNQHLYRVLIKPIRHYLKDIKRLIIIPHGQLYYIPFEALADGPAAGSDFSHVDYLIKRFSINYHYSAHLWLYNNKQQRENREKSFVGFAPVFSGTGAGTGPRPMNADGGSTRDIVVVEQGVRYPELPATERELRAIIDLFKRSGKKAAGYFHRQAAEEIFKSAHMRNYNFIHIATHSLKERGSAGLSGLIFSKPGSASGKEDGILYSKEIYNLDLDAELVVLSSCESGIGRLIKGEGMIALARGFFYSGVRNVIFSLWKVEDRTTSRLMIELYRNILLGRELPAALREAKLSLISDRFTAFPKYWSGFILVGE